VLAWPIAALLIGLGLGRGFNVRPTRFTQLGGVVLMGFVLLYGLALVVEFAFGMGGLFGLIGYHGGVETWSSTKKAMCACPFMVLLGVVVSACTNLLSGKVQV
jgi:hypothetical protein